jgi:hypothetical protein
MRSQRNLRLSQTKQGKSMKASLVGTKPREALDAAIVVESENGLFVFVSGEGPGARRWFFPREAVVRCGRAAPSEAKPGARL